MYGKSLKKDLSADLTDLCKNYTEKLPSVKKTRDI